MRGGDLDQRSDGGRGCAARHEHLVGEGVDLSGRRGLTRCETEQRAAFDAWRRRWRVIVAVEFFGGTEPRGDGEKQPAGCWAVVLFEHLAVGAHLASEQPPKLAVAGHLVGELARGFG